MPILVILGLLLLLFMVMVLGVGLVIAFDNMARAFLWITPVEPATGWLLVGALLGSLAGLAGGMRKGGRPLGVLGPALPLGAAMLLLLLGANYPMPAASPSVGLPQVQVTSEELNMRQEPNRDARIVGRLPQGTLLPVLQVTPDGWYRVQDRRGGAEGWINSKYTSMVSGSLPAPLEVSNASGPPVPAGHSAVTVSPALRKAPPPVPKNSSPQNEHATEPASASSSSVLPDLRGSWRGRYDGRVARLEITQRRGEEFSGTLEVDVSDGPVSRGTFRLAITGRLSDRVVEWQDLRVLDSSAEGIWSHGRNHGRMNASGNSFSGEGIAADQSYRWFFERR